MNRRAYGDAGEDRAARYLADGGAEIIARNYSCRGGEIDIIARLGGALIFVEVKSRSTLKFGTGAEAVTLAKQRRVCRAALHYLGAAGAHDSAIRFDVIEVTPSSIRAIEGAFDYVE